MEKQRKRAEAPRKIWEIPGLGKVIATIVVVAALAIVLALVFFIRATRIESQQRPISILKTRDFHALAFNPRNPDIVFFGHHNGILRSKDGGKSWQPLRVRGDAMALAIPSANPETIYMAGHHVFYKSLDGGEGWQLIPTNLPDTDIHAFALHPEEPRTAYAFVVNYGLFQSEDSGLTWKLLSSNLPDSVMALAVTKGAMYLGTMDNGILKSADGGRIWGSANRGLAGRTVTGLAWHANTDTLYAATLEGLFKSSDAATNWVQVAAIPEVYAMAVSIASPPTILVVNGKGEVFLMRD